LQVKKFSWSTNDENFTDDFLCLVHSGQVHLRKTLLICGVKLFGLLLELSGEKPSDEMLLG
jgi:hypothetical protein